MTINNDCVCAGQIGMTNRCKIHPDLEVKQIADWQTGVWDMIKEKTMTVEGCKHDKWQCISDDSFRCALCYVKIDANHIKFLMDGYNLITENTMTNEEYDVKLGDLVVDRVSGFKGIAVARHIYLYGCHQITVQPIMGKKDKCLVESETFDAPLLDVVEAAAVLVYMGGQFVSGGPEKRIDKGK